MGVFFFLTSLHYIHTHIKTLSWQRGIFFILSSTQGKTSLFGLMVILGEVKQRLLHVFQFKLFIHFPIIALQKP